MDKQAEGVKATLYRRCDPEIEQDAGDIRVRVDLHEQPTELARQVYRKEFEAPRIAPGVRIVVRGMRCEHEEDVAADPEWPVDRIVVEIRKEGQAMKGVEQATAYWVGGKPFSTEEAAERHAEEERERRLRTAVDKLAGTVPRIMPHWIVKNWTQLREIFDAEDRE